MARAAQVLAACAQADFIVGVPSDYLLEKQCDTSILPSLLPLFCADSPFK